MKRNAEKLPVELGARNAASNIVELPRQGNGATTLVESAAHAARPRPEIAVLGWNVRSYRLSLRESKA